jgi:hypothetical protein
MEAHGQNSAVCPGCQSVSPSRQNVTLTVRTDAHADGFGDCPKQTGPPYPEQHQGHGMVGSIDSESCSHWARVRLLFFEWNEVHSSPLLKRGNVFYHVREGELFWRLENRPLFELFGALIVPGLPVLAPNPLPLDSVGIRLRGGGVSDRSAADRAKTAAENPLESRPFSNLANAKWTSGCHGSRS